MTSHRCTCGFGRAEREYILVPLAYLQFAKKMIPEGDYYILLEDITRLSVSLADELRYSWPEHEGFGSSDRTIELRSILDRLGYTTDWTGPGGRLQITGRTPWLVGYIAGKRSGR